MYVEETKTAIADIEQMMKYSLLLKHVIVGDNFDEYFDKLGYDFSSQVDISLDYRVYEKRITSNEITEKNKAALYVLVQKRIEHTVEGENSGTPL